MLGTVMGTEVLYCHPLKLPERILKRPSNLGLIGMIDSFVARFAIKLPCMWQAQIQFSPEFEGGLPLLPCFF
jgi:hypothetical protein